jgi:MFS family permease
VPRVVARFPVDGDAYERLLRPRADLVVEEQVEPGRFVAASGPVRRYERRVDVDADGGVATQTVDFNLAVPYFGWLFVWPFKRAVARPVPPAARPPWWAPPEPIDARASTVLGTLAVLSVVIGYLNTLFTQTIAFAGREFGAGNGPQGVAGSIVRIGGLLALVVVAAADRRGRRTVLLGASVTGCVLAATGALTPSLPWLTASQTVARGFATALLLLVAIVAAEEVPSRCRAYAVSLLALSGGFGAGIAVASLKVADIGPRSWRLLYALPLLALPVLVSVRRRLPESRRFLAPHPEVRIAGHGGRLWLLAVTGLLTNVFIAPQSQFANQYLLSERGFSAGRIALLSLVGGAPGIVGIVVGGRIADVRGRRKVAAVAAIGGALCTVAFFYSRGWPLWAWACLGTMISTAAVPALGVYGPELFPTSLRGRANGLVSICSLGGSAIGLSGAGLLADRLGGLGPAMAVLAIGPFLVALMVLTLYPETAGRELEDLNPEDRASG